MGYAHYDLDDGIGERGYAVADKCHHPSCEAEVDRGLGCLCYGCTKYFCDAHLTYSECVSECFAGDSHQACFACDTGTVEDADDV